MPALNDPATWRWHGWHGRGAMAQRRATKHAEAEARNARTHPDRRRAARLVATRGRAARR